MWNDLRRKNMLFIFSFKLNILKKGKMVVYIDNGQRNKRLFIFF